MRGSWVKWPAGPSGTGLGSRSTRCWRSAGAISRRGGVMVRGQRDAGTAQRHRLRFVDGAVAVVRHLGACNGEGQTREHPDGWSETTLLHVFHPVALAP